MFIEISDITFVNQAGIMHTLCMSPNGHIYWKPISKKLEDSRCAYYVTNILQVDHPEIQASCGNRFCKLRL